MPIDFRSASSYRTVAGAAPVDDFGNTPGTASAVALGATVNGKLDLNDRDVFKVQLTAGTLYNFAAQGVDVDGTVHNLKLSFEDASETGVDDAVVGPGQSYSFIPGASQTYYISVYNPDWEHPAALDYVFKAGVSADDFASTTATTGKLAIGSSVKGRLEDGGGDHDWFAVSLVAGTSYWFTLKGDAERAGTLSPLDISSGGHLAVLDAAGHQVSQETGPDSFSDNAPVLPFVAPTTGTYYLDVSAVSLFSHGTSSGTYRVQAQVATPDEAGSDAAHAATMRLGATVTGVVPLRTDVDTYKVSLVAGTVYVLQRAAADGAAWNSKLDISIFNADGGLVNSVAGTMGKEGLYFRADTTGVYTLTVASNGAVDPSSGSYMLKLIVTPDEYPATAQTSAVLEVSKPVHGTIVVDDVDWVKVHLEAGKRYSFDIHSSNMDLTGNSLDLLDAHGAVLVGATSFSFHPQDVGLVYAAASTGDYYLSVYGRQLNFDYTLSEHLLTGDITGPVLKSVSIPNGATGVPVIGGIRFVFDEAVAFDVLAVLRDASGNFVSSPGGMTQAIGNNTLLMAGDSLLQPNTTYTLSLAEIRDVAGNVYTGPSVYTFTTGADQPADQPGDSSTTAVLTAGVTTTGYLDHMLDGDWYKFHAEAGKRYTVTSTGDAVRYVAIHDAHGNTLAPDVLLNRPASVDYDYYIELYATPSFAGAYTVSVKEVVDDYSATDVGAGKLTLGTALNGALQYAGDVDRFKVALASNVLYKITLSNGDVATGADSALALKMFDPSGKSLTLDYSGSPAGSIMYRLTTAAAGTYTLDVGDSHTPLRGYTITATALVDEYGNTAATAAALALDKQIAGSLQTPTDKDVFSLDLAAGGTYLVSLARSQSSGATPHWTLTDGKGNVVDADPVTGTKDQSFTVGAAGKYYLTVANPSPNPSTDWDTGYGLKVGAVADDFGAAAATAGKLGIGATIAGKLETGGGDSDWFAVTLDAGATYTFSVKGTLQELYGGSATDAPLRLLDAGGKQLAVVNHPSGTNSGNPALSYTAVTKGTYYIDVGMGHSGLSGDYKLQATAVLPDEFGNDNAHAAKLVDGVVANGKLQTAADLDVFKISLDEGALVTIDFGSPAGATVKMTVTDSNGEEIKGALHHGDTSNGTYVDSAQYQVGAAGDYYVTVAAGSAPVPGTAYSVKATVAGGDDFAGDASTTGALVAAKPQHGTISVVGDADWFMAHLEAGHSYSFTLQNGGTLATSGFGTTGGPGIDLYAADGSRVATTLNTADAGVSVAAVATGDYFVSVHGNAYRTGSYSVLETAKPIVTTGDDYGDARETAAVLVQGKSTSGVLGTTTDIDMFKIELVAGTTYTFDGALNNSPSSSVQLSLLAGDGSPLYSTDGAAVSYSYTPTAGGTYYMAVTDSMKLAAGVRYTLLATATVDDYSATAATTGKLAAAGSAVGTVSGKLDAGGGDRDWFAIALDKGGAYTFTLDGATGHEGKNTDEQGGATLRLLDAGGKVLTEVLAGGGTGALAYQPEANGSYFLEVAGGDGHASGAYKLTAVNDADDYAGDATTKGALAVGAPAQGMVGGPADQDWFKVHLDGGKTYVFDMKGAKGHGGTLDTGSAGTGLFMFDATGKTQLAVADGPSDATGETRMVYKAQATGDFYVSTYGAVKGSYTLAESMGAADTTAPQLTAASLVDGATGVRLASKFLLVFDDAVVAGPGLRLTDEHGATLSSAIITASGNTLKIDPHLNLTPGAKYTLSLPEGSVLDLSGNHYAGHASYTFTTVAAASSSTAGDGNDVFSASGNGQKIDGGAGLDTVFYDDTKVPLEIYVQDGHVTVYQTGAGAADTLTGIERLLFPTHAMAFDVSGAGGEAYRMYQAAFDRAPDLSGLGFWINALDSGYSLQGVAQNFLISDEFKKLYGDGVNNKDFVTNLYHNVLHREPEAEGFNFWKNALDMGAERSLILTNFSESAENQAALLPIIGKGFAYIPYG